MRPAAATIMTLDLYIRYRYTRQGEAGGGDMAKRSEQVRDVRFRADANGCLSRPAFEGAVTATLKRDPTATLIHLDLDDLLVLNENGGREAGDKAIATVIGALSK